MRVHVHDEVTVTLPDSEDPSRADSSVGIER